MKLKIKVAIPGQIIWEGEGIEMSIQTTTGKMGILPNHAPLVAALEGSVLTIKNNENTTSLMAISDGYISLEKNNVFIATDRCVLEERIDSNKLDIEYKIALEKYNTAERPVKKLLAQRTLRRLNACYEILKYRKQMN